MKIKKILTLILFNSIAILTAFTLPIIATNHKFSHSVATGNNAPQGIESLKSIDFSVKPEAIPSLPSVEGEAKDYPVSLSLKGSLGSDLSSSEARKGDLDIKWKFAGFNILNGELTCESSPDENGNAVMGDSYITSSGFTKTSTSGKINIRNGVGNYYCVVSATVTYGDKLSGYNTLTKSFPIAILSNKIVSDKQIYPAAGYPINLNYYSDDIVGYRAYQSNNSSFNPDPILPNWNSLGSQEGSLILQKDDDTGNKYLLATSGNGSSDSAYIVNNIGSYKEEILVDMDVNFASSGTSIAYIQGNIPPSGNKISLDFDGSKLTSGTASVSGLTANTWYKLKISYDSALCKYWYKVYTVDGNLIGQSDILNYPSDVQSPTTFGFICSSETENSAVKFKNLTIMKPMSTSLEKDVHGLVESPSLAFDFGKGDEEDIAEGYTAVTPSTIYSNALGYGFTSSNLISGGDPSTDTLNGDYVEGEEIVFKVNLRAGKNYNVKITYQGELSTEMMNDPTTGVIRPSYNVLTENNYSIPLVDGVLDFNLKKINLADGSTVNPRIASIKITPQDDKKKGTKPTWFTYGDSTTNSNDSVKNNVSWGNVAQKYTTMFNFQNRAAGGRNSVTFYNQGKLDGILLDLKPKDVVTFNGMGTNSYNSYFKEHINYAIDGVLQRGGIAVIVTYTPHGAVSNWSNRYDSKTQTFNCARDSDGYTKIYKEIAAERHDVYFIDLGNLVNDQYNQMVIAARNKVTAKGGSNTDAWAAGEAEAQRIIKMFNDHNHYHDEMADIIAPIMVEKMETLYKSIR